MQLEMALCQLRTTVKADELLFWGKITGLTQDYYIAMAVTFKGMYEFPLKQFYYTRTNTPSFAFKEMPTLGLPDVEQDGAIDTAADFFTGDPARLLSGKAPEEGEEAPAEEVAEEEEGETKPKDSEESEEEEIKVPKKNLTELDRLATIVMAIENDCQICPLGAYRLTPEHQMRRASAFSGLNGDTAQDLSSYMHFRNVQDCEQKKADLEKAEATFKEDFLESIQQDAPKGCWNIQSNERGDTVLIRSLNWPGYQFFHKKSTNQFGGMYIGDGLKNQEVHFIV